MTGPTYEELAALAVAWRARIAEQDAEIAELKRQLAASSRNSSRPPSSDGLGKPAPKSLRGRSGRKPGGQPGHEGRTLRQAAVPDAVVVHEPEACTGWGAGLAAAGKPVGVVRRQVFDIPKVHKADRKALRLFVADGVVPGSGTKSHIYVGEFGCCAGSARTPP